TTSIIGYSMPNFVIASLLFLLFGVALYSWTGGAIFYNSGWTGNYGTLDQILVPGFALGFPYASIVARLTRASMLEVIRQDYVRTARAKGLTSRVVIVRHALRNALIPVVTILGPLVIGIVTGSVVIENIFGSPVLDAVLLFHTGVRAHLPGADRTALVGPRPIGPRHPEPAHAGGAGLAQSGDRHPAGRDSGRRHHRVGGWLLPRLPRHHHLHGDQHLLRYPRPLGRAHPG